MEKKYKRPAKGQGTFFVVPMTHWPSFQTVSHSHWPYFVFGGTILYNCVLQWVWSKGPVSRTMSTSVHNLPDAKFVHMHPVKHLIMNHNTKCQKASSAAPKHNDHGGDTNRCEAKLLHRACSTSRGNVVMILGSTFCYYLTSLPPCVLWRNQPPIFSCRPLVVIS
jgi:hypothetical protein